MCRVSFSSKIEFSNMLKFLLNFYPKHFSQIFEFSSRDSSGLYCGPEAISKSEAIVKSNL